MHDKFKECRDKCFRLEKENKWYLSKTTLEYFLENHPINFDESYQYHYFSKPIQKKIFFELFKPKKEVILLQNDYCSIFSHYAQILMHFNDYPKAKVYLKLAHDLNPVNISFIFQLITVYDQEYEGELIEKSLKHALTIAYDTYDLFFIYEKLSQFYKNAGDEEISELLFNLYQKKSFEGFDRNNVINLFNKYDIQLGFNPKIIDIFRFNSTSLHFDGSFADEYNAYYDYWELAEINLFFEND